jgi:hypothetical protein
MEHNLAWKQLKEVTCEFVEGKLLFFPLNDNLWELISFHVLRPKLVNGNNAVIESMQSVEEEFSTGTSGNVKYSSKPMELEKYENVEDKISTFSPTSPVGFALMQCSETENSYSTVSPKELVGEFYSIDDLLVYEPFCADFGPLNLGQM